MSIFLPVTAQIGWLESVSVVYLVTFSLFLIGQHVWYFLQALILASDWLEDFADGKSTAGTTRFYWSIINSTCN